MRVFRPVLVLIVIAAVLSHLGAPVATFRPFLVIGIIVAAAIGALRAPWMRSSLWRMAPIPTKLLASVVAAYDAFAFVATPATTPMDAMEMGGMTGAVITVFGLTSYYRSGRKISIPLGGRAQAWSIVDKALLGLGALALLLSVGPGACQRAGVASALRSNPGGYTGLAIFLGLAVMALLMINAAFSRVNLIGGLGGSVSEVWFNLLAFAVLAGSWVTTIGSSSLVPSSTSPWIIAAGACVVIIGTLIGLIDGVLALAATVLWVMLLINALGDMTLGSACGPTPAAAFSFLAAGAAIALFAHPKSVMRSITA